VELDPIATYMAISDRERAADGTAQRRATQVLRLAGLRAHATILDAGAGQGWYALALGRDHRVVGIDASPQLVRAGVERAMALASDERPLLVLAETQHIPYPDASVDLALSLTTSIGYGSVDDDRATFEELRRVLGERGQLVVEAVSAAQAEHHQARERLFPDGAQVSYSPRFDGATQLLHDTQRFAIGVDRGTFRYVVRAYDPVQLVGLLREAGFAEPRLYAGLDGAPCDPGCPIVLLTRPRLPVVSIELGVRERALRVGATRAKPRPGPPTWSWLYRGEAL
jgi:SAM-dependent methyltransferase